MNLDTKTRLYRGYPSGLACFRAHPEFEELCRTGLYHADLALYRKLLREGTMAQAIPKVRGSKGKPQAPSEKRQKSLFVFLILEGNANKAARVLKLDKETVARHVRSFGYEPMGKIGIKSLEKIKREKQLLDLLILTE